MCAHPGGRTRTRLPSHAFEACASANSATRAYQLWGPAPSHRDASPHSRVDRIRTCDHPLPKRVRYQTAPQPVTCRPAGPDSPSPSPFRGPARQVRRGRAGHCATTRERVRVHGAQAIKGDVGRAAPPFVLSTGLEPARPTVGHRHLKPARLPFRQKSKQPPFRTVTAATDHIRMVGLAGFEPATFRPPAGRAAKLRHNP